MAPGSTSGGQRPLGWRPPRAKGVYEWGVAPPPPPPPGCEEEQQQIGPPAGADGERDGHVAADPRRIAAFYLGKAGAWSGWTYRNS